MYLNNFTGGYSTRLMMYNIVLQKNKRGYTNNSQLHSDSMQHNHDKMCTIYAVHNEFFYLIFLRNLSHDGYKMTKLLCRFQYELTNVNSTYLMPIHYVRLYVHHTKNKKLSKTSRFFFYEYFKSIIDHTHALKFLWARSGIYFMLGCISFRQIPALNRIFAEKNIQPRNILQ